MAPKNTKISFDKFPAGLHRVYAKKEQFVVKEQWMRPVCGKQQIVLTCLAV